MSERDGGEAIFVATAEHRRFVEFCDSCRRHRYIGLCHGPPGVDKTLSARSYARWDMVMAFRKDRVADGVALNDGLGDAVFYSVPVVNSTKGAISSLRQQVTSGQLDFAILLSPSVTNYELASISENSRLSNSSIMARAEPSISSPVGLELSSNPFEWKEKRARIVVPTSTSSTSKRSPNQQGESISNRSPRTGSSSRTSAQRSERNAVTSLIRSSSSWDK